MTVDPEELISDQDAARLLHQKRSTLTAWRHEKRGPAYLKVGRRVFYRRTDILAWLSTRRRETEVE